MGQKQSPFVKLINKGKERNQCKTMHALKLTLQMLPGLLGFFGY